MPAASETTREPVTRDFTVAVFVAHGGRVLLHRHRTLGRWLPPGGHIEPHELPDEAAVREVREETGVDARLIGDQLNTVALTGQPTQLCRPAGVQVAAIRPGHEHIDLVYLASGKPAAARDDVSWFGPEEWPGLGLTAEVEAWCRLAIGGDAGAAPSESA